MYTSDAACLPVHVLAVALSVGLSLPCSLPNFKKWEILKSGKITLISWKMPLLRSGEEVEGGGQREKKKGRREPGPALGSPSLLFLGPDVNRQAEEGCASGSLSNAVSYGHIQSVPNSRGCYHCLAPGSPASSSASPPPTAPPQAIMPTPTCPTWVHTALQPQSVRA